MAQHLVHAFTPPEESPPYINVTRMEDGAVRVIVRGKPYPNLSQGTEEIMLPEADWRSLAWSIYAENEDYMREHGRPVPAHGSGAA